MADLAVSLAAPAVVVARAGLGTLNHTALTMEALDRRGVPACVVVGAWPDEPGLVHVANLVELYAQLAGVVPAGAGAMEPGVFRRSAPGWFTARLFGTLDDVRSLIDGEPY
jgi:dethiobiotin synthetase